MRLAENECNEVRSASRIIPAAQRMGIAIPFSQSSKPLNFQASNHLLFTFPYVIANPDLSGCGNLILLIAYEIASLIIFARKDIATQHRRRESSVGLGSWIPGQARNDRKVFMTHHTSYSKKNKKNAKKK